MAQDFHYERLPNGEWPYTKRPSLWLAPVLLVQTCVLALVLALAVEGLNYVGAMGIVTLLLGALTALRQIELSAATTQEVRAHLQAKRDGALFAASFHLLVLVAVVFMNLAGIPL